MSVTTPNNQNNTITNRETDMTPEQASKFDQLEIKSGAHSSPETGMCVMEAVAFFAGERHSDRPKCVDPVIGAFLRSLNDRLPNDKRQKLKQYVFAVMGTASTHEHAMQRAYMAANWRVRIAIKRADDLGNVELASKLRALPEISASNSGIVGDVARKLRREMWDKRANARAKLAEKIKTALVERGAAVAAAAGAAAAAADAAVAAAAGAVVAAAADAVVAAATVDADAAADAVAAGADAVAAAAAADAAADAVAVVVAAADADAVVAAVPFYQWPRGGYVAVRNAVYKNLLPAYQARYAKWNEGVLDSALELLGQMIAVSKPVVK